jgi:hypothetical protein
VNPNDYQRCWTVWEYVLAQTASSLTWVVLAGIGGVLFFIFRKRIRPFLAKIRGEAPADPVVPRLPNGRPRFQMMTSKAGNQVLVLMLTEDIPIQVICPDDDLAVAVEEGETADGMTMVALRATRDDAAQPPPPPNAAE